MDEKFNAIADGLAEYGYAIVDQFLSIPEVEAILQLDNVKNGLENFKRAAIGKKQDLQINEAVRGDYIQWLDKNLAPHAAKLYLNKLDELVNFLNRSLYLSLKDFEVHLTVYPIGSFYKRHIDQFKKDDHRKLSVICYLNIGWTDEHGGQLRMHLSDKTLDILPLAGRLVCFRSDKIEHEVLPATRERFSLTGWILDQHAELRHL